MGSHPNQEGNSVIKDIHLHHLAGRAYSFKCFQYLSSPKMSKVTMKKQEKLCTSTSAFHLNPEFLGSALLTSGAGYSVAGDSPGHHRLTAPLVTTR